METETIDIVIERPVDVVWPFIGDFGGLGWMPGVESVTVDGDVRTVSVGGMEVKEQLVELDQDAHSLSYSIIGGPVPIDSHLCVITLEPHDEGTKVTWQVSSAPDGTASFFRDVYSGALKALKAEAEA